MAVRPLDCILLVGSRLSANETCRQIRKQPRGWHPLVIMVCGGAEPCAKIEAINAGADGYIIWQGDTGHLRARVQAQLRRRQFEIDLRRTREMELRALNEDLVAFAYAVAHDLRQPLRSVEGFSKLLAEEHSSSLDDNGRHCLTRIHEAASRMHQIIEGLMVLSKVTRGELHRQEEVQIGRTARQVLARLADGDPKRSVETIVPDRVVGNADPRLIETLLENLLGNAWKFTSKEPHARIEFGEDEGSGQRLFFVRDNGVGFSMEHADRLFVPFQRLHSPRDFEGNGIGLATVEKIIGRHGGRIWAESAPGKGTTFYFTLDDSPRPASRIHDSEV